MYQKSFKPNPFASHLIFAMLLYLFSGSGAFAQCPEQTADATIYTSTVWSSDALIDHNIEVATGATLTMLNSTFSFIPNVTVTIDMGASLIVNNSILTNDCTGLWGGIVVVGDTTLPQNDAMSSITIENGSQINYASIGVMMGDGNVDSAGGGGILTMSYSSVNNCGDGIVFYHYPDSNISVIDTSSFTSSVILPGLDSAGTDAFIELHSVHGIFIDGCSFINSIDPSTTKVHLGGAGSGVGIAAYNSGLVVTAYPHCAMPVYDYRICCTGTENTFKGLGIGISNKNPYTGVPRYAFSCLFSTFTDNLVDIYDESSRYTLISHCYFTKDAIFMSNSSKYPRINTTESNQQSYYPRLAKLGLFDIFVTNALSTPANLDIADNTFYWEVSGVPDYYTAYCTANAISPTATPYANGIQIQAENLRGNTTSAPTNESRIFYNTFGIDIHTSTGSYCSTEIQFYVANAIYGDNGGLLLGCNTYHTRGWSPTGSRYPGDAGSQVALCQLDNSTGTGAQIYDWILEDYNYAGSIVYLQLPDQGNSTDGAGNNFTDYNSASLNDNGPGSSGCDEYNILYVDASFTMNYYNYTNWLSGHDIYPEIWKDYYHNPVTSTYQRNASGKSCSAPDCMNFVQESRYTPGGYPPAAPAPMQVYEPKGVKLFPNPTADLLNIQYNFDAGNNGNQPASIQLQIVDFTGKTISATMLNQTEGSMVLDTRSLASGIYFYRFTDTNQNKVMDTGKFAVSR